MGKSHAADIVVPAKNPYKIVEIYPGGNQRVETGISSNIDPTKIAADIGVTIYPEDKISAMPDPKLEIGSVITVHRAPVITVTDANTTTTYRSWQKTVAGFLAEKNIELGTSDEINPPTSAEIFDGSSITITRVAITTVVETAAIPFSVTKANDPNLNWGETRVSAGTNGQEQLNYLVRRENGVEVSRTLESTQTILAPVNEIDYTGTKVTIISSVSGRATMTPVSTYVVSPNYPRGTLIRITNRANGAQIFETVNATWGTASPPAGVVLDLAPTFLSQLGCPSSGCSSVTVDEIQQ